MPDHGFGYIYGHIHSPTGPIIFLKIIHVGRALLKSKILATRPPVPSQRRWLTSLEWARRTPRPKAQKRRYRPTSQAKGGAESRSQRRSAARRPSSTPRWTVRRRLSLVFPLPPWLRQCLPLRTSSPRARRGGDKSQPQEEAARGLALARVRNAAEQIGADWRGQRRAPRCLRA